MYLAAPGGLVQALDATTGDLLWEYARELSRDVARGQRTKSLAIYQDLVFYTAPDGYVVGLDARSGKLRWEAPTGRAHTSGPLVVDGMVISGGACMRDVTPAPRPNCFIAAHDALTGKERWRFYTTPAPGEPGDETWYGVPLEKRRASPWGFQGSYDPSRKLIYWGVANPNPDPRYSRHKDISVGPLVHAGRAVYRSRPSRWMPPPGNWPGISSICRPTIGTSTTRTNGRCSERGSTRIPSR